MKFSIAVLGSSAYDEKAANKAIEIGKEIAKHKCTILTGATTGIPNAAALACRKAGEKSIGISPAENRKEHLRKYKYPTEACNTIIYTGFGLNGRNVILVRSADAVIIINGRIGTLNEFTIAYDEGKLIGVLEESGGIAEEIRRIVKAVNKNTGAEIIYEKNTKKLVQKIVNKFGKGE